MPALFPYGRSTIKAAWRRRRARGDRERKMDLEPDAIPFPPTYPSVRPHTKIKSGLPWASRMKLDARGCLPGFSTRTGAERRRRASCPTFGGPPALQKPRNRPPRTGPGRGCQRRARRASPRISQRRGTTDSCRGRWCSETHWNRRPPGCKGIMNQNIRNPR